MKGVALTQDGPKVEKPSIRRRKRHISDAHAYQIRQDMVAEMYHRDGFSIRAIGMVLALSDKQIRNDLHAAEARASARADAV